MAENLKKIGTRFQIRIKVLDSLANSRDFRNLLKAYNRAASKLKKRRWKMNMTGPVSGTMRTEKS